jgi:hypothetical protein
MVNPRKTGTNAADSAPGVDDGRTGAPAPSVNSKPGGRKPVFWLVAIAAIILAIVFIARPQGSREAADEQISLGTTRGEVAATNVPGAQPDTAQSAATPR